jgi:hypothetical protein
MGLAAIGLYIFAAVTTLTDINLPPSFGVALPLGAIMTCLFFICRIMDGAIQQSEDQSKKESSGIPAASNSQKKSPTSATRSLSPGELVTVR